MLQRRDQAYRGGRPRQVHGHGAALPDGRPRAEALPLDQGGYPAFSQLPGERLSGIGGEQGGQLLRRLFRAARPAAGAAVSPGGGAVWADCSFNHRIAAIRWRHMALLGQEHMLFPRGAVMVQTASPTARVTASPSVPRASGCVEARSFLARFTVPLLHRAVRYSSSAASSAAGASAAVPCFPPSFHFCMMPAMKSARRSGVMAPTWAPRSARVWAVARS